MGCVVGVDLQSSLRKTKGLNRVLCFFLFSPNQIYLSHHYFSVIKSSRNPSTAISSLSTMQAIYQAIPPVTFAWLFFSSLKSKHHCPKSPFKLRWTFVFFSLGVSRLLNSWRLELCASCFANINESLTSQSTNATSHSMKAEMCHAIVEDVTINLHSLYVQAIGLHCFSYQSFPSILGRVSNVTSVEHREI